VKITNKVIGKVHVNYPPGETGRFPEGARLLVSPDSPLNRGQDTGEITRITAKRIHIMSDRGWMILREPKHVEPLP
jgi:hypothetical protein